jgi:hypothetical protein
MQKGTRDEIVKVFEAELEEWARNLLERSYAGETSEDPTTADGDTRDLLTLMSPRRTSKFPAYEKVISIPGSFPTGRGPPWNFPKLSALSTLSG